MTDPAVPVDIAGNLRLQMRMHDLGEGAVDPDTIGFTLWSGKQGDEQLLLFSSNWEDHEAIEQGLGGGNLRVHSSSIAGM